MFWLSQHGRNLEGAHSDSWRGSLQESGARGDWVNPGIPTSRSSSPIWSLEVTEGRGRRARMSGRWTVATRWRRLLVTRCCVCEPTWQPNRRRPVRLRGGTHMPRPRHAPHAHGHRATVYSPFTTTFVCIDAYTAPAPPSTYGMVWSACRASSTRFERILQLGGQRAHTHMQGTDAHFAG